MFFDVQFVDSITYFYHDLSMGWDSSWEQFANRQRNIWMSQHSHQWFKLHIQIVLFELSPSFNFPYLFTVKWTDHWWWLLSLRSCCLGIGKFSEQWMLFSCSKNKMNTESKHIQTERNEMTKWDGKKCEKWKHKSKKTKRLKTKRNCIETCFRKNEKRFVLFVFPFCCTLWEIRNEEMRKFFFYIMSPCK